MTYKKENISTDFESSSVPQNTIDRIFVTQIKSVYIVFLKNIIIWSLNKIIEMVAHLSFSDSCF